ncbi:lipid A deacylase LpxR family protein [Polaribacter sp. Asnod1-A03]|uniref:lipid A deacylase LpxR family protein n=1 Tax=Polaribacter sp. Asnod1-A03 TaxID=3160581 RepID=UPI00386F2947
MKKNSLIFFLFISSFLISQEKFSKEISFTTDNDLYVSIVKDRYYTSGIFLSYRFLSNTKKPSLEKKIIAWKLAQEMYTPYKATAPIISLHDRPFAGYLYASYGILRAYKNNKILNTSFQLGSIGKNAFAKETQNLIHSIYGYREATGWEYQIKNAIALNFNATYLKTILQTENNYLDITWTNNLNIGTVYTNISTGFKTRIGLRPLQKMINSIAFNTNLNNSKTNYYREIESFFYIKPSVRYAVYDATLEGSFLNDSSEVTNTIKPIVFNLEAGLMFTSKRFNFGYAFIYNTQKSEGLRYTNGQSYGKITINYLLH